MKEFCFLITDKNHVVYYASISSNTIFDKQDHELVANNWLELIADPTPTFFRNIIKQEVEQTGFFNGYICVSSSGKLWFCDYGKRYDSEGKHIGYDLVINNTADSATEYMKHFYSNLNDKVSKSERSATDLYEEEKDTIEKTVGTDFNEFITALQGEHE